MRADIQRHRLGTALVVALAAAGLPQAAPAATRGYIALAIPPSTNSEVLAAAIDLNGDGIADNQFAQVLIALGSLNLDFSAPVTSGQVVYLMRVTSADATFQNDTAALGEWIVGQPTAPLPPDFSGGGSFQIAPGVAQAPRRIATAIGNIRQSMGDSKFIRPPPGGKEPPSGR